LRRGLNGFPKRREAPDFAAFVFVEAIWEKGVAIGQTASFIGELLFLNFDALTR